ncbi:MAG: XrtA/PEP-CTERM system TPR-repeat protein PrsT [Alphaproteobacteria bacterium]
MTSKLTSISRPLAGLCFALCFLTMLVAPAAAVTAPGGGEPYLEDAQAYLDSGEIRAAIAVLKSALQNDPEDVEARALLANVYIEAQDGPSAEKELRTAYDQGLDDDRYWEPLARALLTQGRYAGLLDEVPADRAAPGRRAALLTLRGRAFYGLKQYDDAKAEFQKAFDESPGYVQAKTGLARVLIAQGQADEALALIEEALGIDDESVSARVIQGELSRMSRDFERSVEIYGEVLKTRPNNIEALLGQAAALIDLNRDIEAQRNIDTALELQPRHPLALYLSALMLTKRQSFKGAEAVLDRAGRSLDNYLPAQYLRGAIAYAQGNLEQAFYFLNRFVEQAPTHANGRRLLGGTLVRQGNFEQAVRVFSPLLQAGGDARLYAMAAGAYLGLRDYESAIGLYERAVAADPENSLYRTQLAVARLGTGDPEAAIQELEAAVDADPGSRRAPLMLVRHNLNIRDYDAALAVANQFVAATPEDPSAHNLLGAVLLAQGDREAAKDAFDRAHQLNPAFLPAVQNLARLDLEAGNTDAARARYEEVLEAQPGQETAMIEISRIAGRQKGPEAAAKWLEDAADANPDSSEAALRLIELHIDNEEFVKAIAVASALEQRLPDRPAVLEALARAQTLSGDAVSGVVTYGRLAALVPERPDVFVALGRAQLAAGDVFNARASYRRALELDPNLVQPVLELIIIEIDSGRLRYAMEVATALQEAQPEQPLGDILVGHVNGKLGNKSAALEAFGRAETKINSASSALRLFHGYREIEEQARAASLLEDWLSQYPRDLAIRGVLASAYLDDGAYQESIEHHRVLLEANPNNPMILNNLAWLYQSMGDDRALETAEQAYSIRPDAVIIKDTYGWVLVEHGRADEGARALEEAGALAPDEPDIQYHLALARVRQGREDEACALLRTILMTGGGFRRRDDAQTLSNAQACR